jgi:lipopolysaccharide/colanic/teichoic acid biosynthesis glycosyltransferase
MKRSIDLAGSIAGLFLTTPIIAWSALAVYIEDGGNPFYSQIRVGEGGKEFRIYKVRSMIKDADKISSWTVDNDPRQLKVGAFLRKSHIDELPQLWNVLIGDMSLVGPRPETPEHVERLKVTHRFYHRRLLAKPGITGLSQALGFKGDTCMRTRTVLDALYIKRRSNLLDIKLILATIFSPVLLRAGVV